MLFSKLNFVHSGVSQLAVVVNKLDTVDWNEDRFKEISSKLGVFLKQAGYRDCDVTYVPCSGLAGENLVEKSKQDLLSKWYRGPSLYEVIGILFFGCQTIC